MVIWRESRRDADFWSLRDGDVCSQNDALFLRAVWTILVCIKRGPKGGYILGSFLNKKEVVGRSSFGVVFNVGKRATIGSIEY